MTPLLEFLRLALPEERERLADLAGTSVGYLYQLAGCHRTDMKASLAFRIADATRTMHAESDGRLPKIEARTLTTMCLVRDLTT